MDQEFIHKIENIHGQSDVVFRIDHNTYFKHVDGCTIIRYVFSADQTVEHKLGTIEDLCEGNIPFDSSDDDWTDKYLPLLMSIESAITRVHKLNPDLKDKAVIAVLERLVVKPDINLQSQLAEAIQDHIKLCLATNSYSKRELAGCLKKVLRSVKRHHRVDGPKGYLDFIKDKI